MKIKSVRTKIMILIVGCILVSNLFLGVLNYRKSQEIAIDILKDNTERELKNITEYYFDKMINDMEYIVTVWATNESVVNYTPSQKNRKIVNTVPDDFMEVYDQWLGLVGTEPDISWIYYALDSNGSIYVAPLDETMPLDYDARKRRWYQGTVEKSGHVFWTEPYLDAGDSGKILQTVSKAVYKDGELKGVVGLDIEINKFTEIIETLSFAKNSDLFLLNQNNQVIGHNSKNKELFEAPLEKIVNSTPHTEIIKLSNEQYVFSWTPLSINNWKVVAIQKVSFHEAFIELQKRLIGIVVVTIILGVVVASKGAQNALKPLNDLTDVTKKVAQGDLSARTDIHSNDEFKQLSNSFNHMLDQMDGLIKDREKNYLKTVRALANAIEASDKYTRGHCDRVGHISARLADKLDLSVESKAQLEIACILHDIGKIGIPDSILNKPARLSCSEYQVVKKHPQMGYEIVREVEFLKEAAEILLQHHERLDGTGYPFGLISDEIRIESRILAVADVYDAMSSFRVYREKAMSKLEILGELEKSKGTQLDQDIVVILMDMLEKDELEEPRTGV